MAARGKAPATPQQPVVQFIPIDKVIPPTENRDSLGDMEQLVASVKARGVAQAILVRPIEDGTYRIVFGERRWRAAKEAGLTAIKAEVRELDDLEAALEQIAENMDREDLTSLEKARALRRALDAAKRQGVRMGQREWAAKLGKSQATVSKYLTLLALYTQLPAFKEAYDAGRATDTDAIHLGKLVRQVGKDSELVERAVTWGLRFGFEQAVSTELKVHERRQARAKVVAELEERGAILAPDDWYSGGGRRLATLGLSPESHHSEPCYAVWVDNTAEVEPICMNPARHVQEAAASSSPTPSGGAQRASGSSPDARAASPVSGSAAGAAVTSGAAPENAAEQAAAEEARRRRAEAEAERQAHEEAERARLAELESAASKRREVLQTWLTTSGRLPRPVSDRYLFSQIVNLLGDQTTHSGDVCGLLQAEIGDSGSVAALIDYAEQGAEQLRRAALALMTTWAEDRLVSEQDWVDPFVREHYRLLSELGYQPCEIEVQGLAAGGAEEAGETPAQDDTKQPNG
jgi:ParB/RepB/Spo0J family partition protein